MSLVVRDDGFHPDDWSGDVVDVASDTAVDALPALARSNGLVRITLGAYADGRAFTLARGLRAAGFTGRLRAAGPIIADQYAMARRSGFDEVEISQEMAQRQDEAQWLARANWRAHDYQARLRG